ncbi:MAG: hypothetical protein JXM79_04460 [Sedimentisphaerales bacterium]|nr:hypothetical protein [Sedimentisphaerales bacterium]
MRLSSVLSLLLAVCFAAPACAQEIQMQPFVVDHFSRVDSPADVSFLLDAPAGRDGHITVKGGHFVKPNGERFRIWGVNLTGWTRGSTLLPPKKEASMWAAEMARFGINCVRFHFLDLPTRDPAAAGFGRGRPAGLLDRNSNTTQVFDANALDRLDFFVSELKKHGIYTNLNLNVGLTYREGDGVPDWDVIRITKGMTYVGERMLELQRDYARRLLTHYNPYTKSEYRHEPAVAFVEIVNENSVFEFWSRNWLNGELTKENRVPQLDFTPYYKRVLDDKYQKWLAENKTPQELAELRRLAGVGAGEAIPRTRRGDFRDTPDELFYTEAEFYTFIERGFFLGMKSFLKDELGVKSLIIATADHTYWIPPQPLIRTTSLLDGVDGHVYWEHPSIWGRRNTPMVNEPLGSTIVKLSRSPMAGKPYTVSETNHPNPNEYAAEMIPILAAYGAFHDWDGIYFYTFEPKVGDRWERYVTDNFDITLDPVKMIQMSVGALLFSRPDVAPAEKTVLRTYSTRQVYESNRLSEAERPYFTPGFPLSIPLRHGSRIEAFDSEPTATFSDELNPPYISDTGELIWRDSDENGGLVTIETPRTQALVGFIRDNQGVAVRHIKPEIKNDFAVVTLSSLTPEPLWKCSNLLLTACSRWQNTGSQWNDRRTMWGRGPRSEGWGTDPTLIEPVNGWLILRDLDGAVRVELIPLDGAAKPIGSPIQAKMVEEGWEIPLGEPATTWYRIAITR